jgi:type IV secretion system protein VirB10
VILGSAGTSHGSSQRRLTLEFHRMIMPDGYCVRLERAVGADQQGATGLTGRVDTHWKSLIATAAILGAVEGLGTSATFANGGSGVLELSTGVNRQTAEEGTQILNQQMNRNSSIRVYEGTRVVLKTGEDLLVPDWENHRVPKNL